MAGHVVGVGKIDSTSYEFVKREQFQRGQLAGGVSRSRSFSIGFGSNDGKQTDRKCGYVSCLIGKHERDHCATRFHCPLYASFLDCFGCNFHDLCQTSGHP